MPGQRHARHAKPEMLAEAGGPTTTAPRKCDTTKAAEAVTWDGAIGRETPAVGGVATVETPPIATHQRRGTRGRTVPIRTAGLRRRSTMTPLIRTTEASLCEGEVSVWAGTTLHQYRRVHPARRHQQQVEGGSIGITTTRLGRRTGGAGLGADGVAGHDLVEGGEEEDGCGRCRNRNERIFICFIVIAHRLISVSPLF